MILSQFGLFFRCENKKDNLEVRSVLGIRSYWFGQGGKKRRRHKLNKRGRKKNLHDLMSRENKNGRTLN